MHVYLADIDAIMLPLAQAEIQGLAAPLGGSATAVVTDVADNAAVLALRDAVLAAHKTVHFLHCNAGLELKGGVLEPMKSWETTLRC
jgi:NADP-dependent 3-hydroxy acid dehydrogenase YdfG